MNDVNKRLGNQLHLIINPVRFEIELYRVTSINFFNFIIFNFKIYLNDGNHI